jgi:hypothetical protein
MPAVMTANAANNYAPKMHIEYNIGRAKRDFFSRTNTLYSDGITATVSISESDKNFIHFDKLFKSEKKRKNIVNDAELRSAFGLLASVMSSFNFQKGSFEIVDEKSIKFTLIFPENYMMMVTKPLHQLADYEDTNLVILSIFQNRKPVYSQVLPPDELLVDFDNLTI